MGGYVTRYGACRLHRCLTPLSPSPWTLAHIPWTLTHPYLPLHPLTHAYLPLHHLSHTSARACTPTYTLSSHTHLCSRHQITCLSTQPVSQHARAHKHSNTRAGTRARASTTSPSAGAVTWSPNSSPPRRTRCCARGSRTRTTSLTWRRARSRTERGACACTWPAAAGERRRAPQTHAPRQRHSLAPSGESTTTSVSES